jgi:hypothetical protein
MSTIKEGADIPLVFVSHASEDEELVNRFLIRLESKFQENIRFFSTSRIDSKGGTAFFKAIEENITNAGIHLLFLTADSINKKWLYFEAGGGYFRGIPVFPVCYKNISPRYLPFPLFTLESYPINHIEGLRALLKVIAKTLNVPKPKVEIEEFADFCKSLGMDTGEAGNSREVKNIFKFCKKLFEEDSQEDIMMGLRLVSAIQSDEALELAASQLFSEYPEVRKLSRKIVSDISSPNTIKILLQKLKKTAPKDKVEGDVFKLIHTISTPNDIEVIDGFIKNTQNDNQKINKILSDLKKSIVKKYENYYSGWRDELDPYHLDLPPDH